MRSRAHLIAIVSIVLAVGALYAGVTAAGYCGYDDFNEGYRAAFFDGADPRRIVTALHFTPFMYRPVTSALQLATWDVAAHRAVAFRVRDLAMHLVSIACLYGIAFMLARSVAVATSAALLFGVSPYANQAIVVAIWTNTTAYALLLAALFFFLVALDHSDRRRPFGASLAACFGCVLVAAFTYEPTIAGVAMMIAFLALCRPGGTKRSFLTAFGTYCAALGLVFFGVRRIVGVGSAPLLPPGTIVAHVAEYLGALAAPVDPVLGHALGAPLPYAGESFRASFFAAPLAGLLVLGIVFAVCRARSRPASGPIPWRIYVFLLTAIVLSLVPIAAFRDHVSEFNLYIPAALFGIGVTLAVRRFGGSTATLATVTGLLAASYIAGDVLRNVRIVACANTAERILSQFPIAAWRAPATPVIDIATAPGTELSKPFGAYNYSGIETIEVPETRIEGMQEALRLRTGNDRVVARIVDAKALATGCAHPKTCYTVTPAGAVRDISGPRTTSDARGQ